jgi:hypothetical protein
MMNNLLMVTTRFLKRNSSTILTCMGAAGVVVTGVMAAKATPKAMALLEQAEEEKGEELTVVEKVQYAGPAYIPAVLTGTATIACIFGANVLNKRKQASLMSAYAFMNNSYREYKMKVRELYGEEAVEHIREEIADDKYAALTTMEPMHEEEVLFFDDFSLQFFYSTIEDVLEAERRFNQNFMMSGSACLNEFYDILGIGRIDAGYQLGWAARSGNTDLGLSKIEFQHQKMIVGDDVECYAIVMHDLPTEGYIY